MIKVPGMKPGQTHTPAVVNLIDLYPTLAEICGLPKNKDLDGRSFAPVLRDHTTPWDYPTLSTIGFQNHSIRDMRYRYTRYADGTEEFYDHKNDPLERTNLINQPEVASLVQKYKAMLPQHDEPEAGEYEIDKNRLKRTLKKIAKEDKTLAKKAKQNELDPEYIKEVYRRTK